MKTNEHELPGTVSLDQNCFWELDLYTGQLYWSDEICAVLGFEKNKVPSFEQLMQFEEATQNIRAAFNRAIHQGIPFQLRLPSLAANGRLVICTTAVPVYDDYEKCIAIKGILQLETERENTAVTAPNALEKIALHQIMLYNFAKIVSHDLRSQTVNLQMAVDFTGPKKNGEDMQEFISNIKTISNNLNQTVGYLNTLTKI